MCGWGLSAMGLDLIRSLSCQYLFSFLFGGPNSPEKNSAISSLEDVYQASSLLEKRAWAVFKFSFNPLVFNARSLSGK